MNHGKEKRWNISLFRFLPQSFELPHHSKWGTKRAMWQGEFPNQTGNGGSRKRSPKDRRRTCQNPLSCVPKCKEWIIHHNARDDKQFNVCPSRWNLCNLSEILMHSYCWKNAEVLICWFGESSDVVVRHQTITVKSTCDWWMLLWKTRRTLSRGKQQLQIFSFLRNKEISKVRSLEIAANFSNSLHFLQDSSIAAEMMIP